MRTTIRPEVFHRLVFAKSLLLHAEAACATPNDRFSFARGLLLLHDAAEAALGAVADHLQVTLSGNKYLLDYYELIKNADAQHRVVPYQTQMRNLNKLRNDIKHHGLFAEPTQAAHFPSTVAALLQEICKAYFDLEFDGISLKSLIQNEKVTGWIEGAEALIEQGKYEDALISLGYAMYDVVEHETTGILEDAILTSRLKTKRKRFLPTKPFGTDFTVKLLQQGVDPYTYHRFRNLTPDLEYDQEEERVVYHWDKTFGHDKNWTEQNVRFCLAFAIETALRFERRLPYSYQIHNYQDVYEDVIEPVGDEAEFWNYGEVQPSGSPSAREVIFRLPNGQAIVGLANEDEDNPHEWMVISLEIPKTERWHGHMGYVRRDAVKVTPREHKP